MSTRDVLREIRFRSFSRVRAWIDSSNYEAGARVANIVRGQWLRIGGVLVAVIGFGVTRLFVAETIQMQTLFQFILAGLIPLAIGLSVTIYGVTLAIGAFSREYVNTVARYCFLGTLTAVIVVVVTATETVVRGEGMQLFRQAPLLIANVLLGGVVVGVLMGDRSAENRKQQQEIRRQANRALYLNRVLRHEVINATTIIQGHAKRLVGTKTDASDIIQTITDASQRIDTTIDEIGDLIETKPTSLIAVDRIIRTETEAIQSRFSTIETDVDNSREDVRVAADDRLQLVFRELLENAAQDSETSRIEVTVEPGSYWVSIAISDDGSGLPEKYEQLLTSGTFPEYDDPAAGFGLQIVRLLVLEYDGQLEVDEGINGEGTTIRIALPAVNTSGELTRAVNVPRSDLYSAIGAGFLAGAVMGLVFTLSSDLFPIIGALYGVDNAIIGWITHLFHSVVFAAMFAGGISHPWLQEHVESLSRGTIAGIVWGVLLWLIAAGIIMPLWLQTVGVMAMIPNLPPLGLVSHAIWGAVLGSSYTVLKNNATGD
ncbi:MAG: ATP-binding protein [Halobacteriales archaeon]